MKKTLLRQMKFMKYLKKNDQPFKYQDLKDLIAKSPELFKKIF
jgi:hypothetical protein